MEHQLTYLLSHFGYYGIILALIGGIIGLPLPDEILLTFIGYCVFQGNIAYIPSLLSAFLGTSGGISLSYLLGIKLGLPFLTRFGPRLHITEDRINKTRQLFTKLGPYLLFIGYFIPGIRHITAYLAGINGYSFKKFARYAYPGALLWSFTFITLGRSLGGNWKIIAMYISKYRIYLMLAAVSMIWGAYLFWKRRQKLQ